METTLTEQELLTAIRYRYRTAAELLYGRYGVILYKVIFCTLKDRELADEVLQEVFLLIWNSIDDYLRQDSSLLLWMSGLARAAAKQKLKISSMPGVSLLVVNS